MSLPVELPASVAEAFRRICDPSPAALAVVDLAPESTTVVLANRALEELLRAGPLAGRTLAEFTDPEAYLDDVHVRTRLVGGVSKVYERAKRYHRPDGTTVDVHIFGAVLGRESGRQLAFAIFTPADEWLRRGYQATPHLGLVLADIRAALLRGDPEDEVLDLVCQSAGRLVEIENAGILALDEPDVLRLTAVDRGLDDPLIGQRYPVNGASYSEAIDARRTYQYEVRPGALTPFVGQLPESIDVTRPLFIAVTPMLSSGRTLGALIVRRASRAYEPVELEVLETFAQEVGESLALAELREDQERLRMLEVREQIARDIHDEVTQDLIAVRLGLVHLVPRVSDAGLRAEFVRTLDDLDDATRRLRDVVAGLDETTSVADFVDVLRSITSSKAERALIDWDVEVVGPVARLRDDERAELLRVVNEAVSNVVRHAHAERVDVSLTVHDASVVVIVEDDGVGLTAASGRHPGGLANLAARADARRGEYSVTSGAAGGTRLRWAIPLGEVVAVTRDGVGT